MSLSVTLGLGWLVLANLIAMFPSRHHHWPAAYALIAVGLPLIVWIFATEPWWVGVALLLGAASVLRWPVRYLGRWLRRRVKPASV